MCGCCESRDPLIQGKQQYILSDKDQEQLILAQTNPEEAVHFNLKIADVTSDNNK